MEPKDRMEEIVLLTGKSNTMEKIELFYFVIPVQQETLKIHHTYFLYLYFHSTWGNIFFSALNKCIPPQGKILYIKSIFSINTSYKFELFYLGKCFKIFPTKFET